MTWTLVWPIIKNLVVDYWKPILLIIVVVGIEQFGEHRIQVKWDDETTKREAAVQQAKEQNLANIKAITDQHQKDLEYAKSQAGRAAVAAWLKSHGLLPNGSAVPGSCGGQTQSPGVPPDGQNPESGTGTNIQEFATECAKGALMNIEWREWAIKEGLDSD